MRRFRDRFEAGEGLAEALPHSLAGNDVVVIALARGGIQAAVPVARRLAAPLDVVAVRKVGHPRSPEYAIGAVAPGEGVYLRAPHGLTDEQIAHVVRRAQAAAEELDRRLHARRAPIELAGRRVVLVDDGLATGATMVAAIHWARARGAIGVIVAVPVAAALTTAALRRDVDVVCANEPAELGAVGFWYEQFDQLTDNQVVSLLDAYADERAASA